MCKENKDKVVSMIKMDNRISIAHMIALLIHGGGLIWYISGVAHDVNLNTEYRMSTSEIGRKVEMHDQFIKSNQGVATKVAVIEERTAHIARALDEIKREFKEK